MFDPDFSETDKVDRLFHTLWTKAVHTDNYDKSEWRELGRILNDAGYRR